MVVSAAAGARILLHGLEERFAALIVEALRAESGSVEAGAGGTPRKGDLMIAANSVADIDGQLAAQDEALGVGARLLRVAWSTDHLWLGPGVEAGKDGCVRCFHLWTLNSWSRATAESVTNHESLMSCWSEPFRMAAAAAIAAEALAAPAKGPAAFFLSTDFRGWSRHNFFRHPECERCTPLPDDRPEAALDMLGQGGASAASSYRALGLDALERIAEIAVDKRCGLVRSVAHTTASILLPTAFATLYPRAKPTDVEIGVGRTGCRRTDRAVAVIEGVERFAGLQPRGRRTRVSGRFSELEEAVDPRRFILHHPEQRDEPGFRFDAYSPDAVYDWVWAYSFRRDAPALVPEQLAYYALPAAKPGSGSRFVFETSNGCALGGTIEEAVLHGLFEVIERDAFLANWYARRPLARVDMSGVDDPLIRAMLARCGAHQMEVEVLDMRAGLRTPAFAVSVVNRTLAGQPALALAAGAHLDPIRALQGALVEAVTAFARRDPAKAAKRPERGRELLAHPERVQSMEDHADQCWPAEAIGARDFLRSPTPELDWPATFGAPADARVSVPDELAALVAAVLGVASDVLVVDQSFEPFRGAGLNCVKVLAPGLLPMTFGNQHRRISEERLRALAPETAPDRHALASLPHPFP